MRAMLERVARTGFPFSEDGMTTEPEPTRPTIDQLETEYLTRLMLRDAKVFAQRMNVVDRMTTRVPMQGSAVAIRRLADATGCPGNMSPVAFLLQTGWLTQTDDGGYVFTKKVCLPRGAKKKYRSRPPRPRDTSGAEEHREAERAMS
jgi:hypothetical protein